MSRQFWGETIAVATADGVSINTSVAETVIYGNITLPANYLQDGRALRLRAIGKHSTLGSGTVTLTFRVRSGGVAGVLLCASGAIVQLVSLTNCVWDLDAILNVRTNGSAGTIMANGIARVYGATVPTIGSATGAPAIGPMTVGGQTAPAASAAVDLTVDQALAITVQMGASSASNIVQGLSYVLEALN